MPVRTLNLAANSKLETRPVGCAWSGKLRCSACKKYNECYIYHHYYMRQLTSRILFIVPVHLSTSSFVCSYAASRSRRSCVRCGRGADRVCVLDFEEGARILVDFLSERRVVDWEDRGARRSSRLSFEPNII